MDPLKYKVAIIGLFFSSFIAMIFWRFLIVPTGFFIALMVAIVFFLTYVYVISGEKEVNHNSPSPRLKKALFSCCTLLSVLSVLFVHPISNTVEFISWNAIPLPNLLRLLLSSFLVLFSPGYMILSLVHKNENLTGTEKILFSVLISLFILPFFGLLSFAFGSNIQQVGTLSVILLNLTLLMLFIFVEREKTKVNEKISISFEKLILLSLLIFISILMLSKYSLNLTWDYGDLDIYYGYSVSFTKGVLPLSPIGPGLDYPYWPFTFLAQFFITSGVPYVNAFQFLSIPITFLPILSLYIMTSAFFERLRHKKIPIIATLLGFFGGGFGWIFGVHLLTSSQTVQSLYELFEIMGGTNSGYLIPSFYSAPGITGIYPLYTFALTSIFALIWLIYSKRADKLGNLRYVLIPVMIALGYLAHVAEIVFFIFIFLASILILKREDVFSYRKCAISIIVGLILIALPDIIVKGCFYTEGNPFTYYGFSLYYGALVLAVLAFFLSFIKNHLKGRPIDLKIDHDKIRPLKLASLSLITYFYGLSLIIWAKVFETYARLPTTGMNTEPWYAWPNRLGIIGLLALPGIICLVHKHKNIKEYSFFIFLVPVSFIIARVLHVYPYYMEDRLTFFIMIPTVILASFMVLKLGQSLNKHVRSNFKNVLFGSVLSMILILGFLPGLLTNEAVDFNYWTTLVAGGKLSNLELDALNFLRLNTSPNGSVLTLTTGSSRLLSYAGLFPVQTYVNRDPSLIFTPSFPETAIYSLTKSQVKYLYLSSADKKELEQNPSYSGFARDYLLKYLPIAFQNEEVIVYEVPDFSIPTSSNTALVTVRSNDSASGFLPLSMAALSQNEYSTVLEDDPTRFNCSTLILTHDLDQWNEAGKQDFQGYMDWINRGGRLIVLESLGTWPSYESRNWTVSSLGFANALSIYHENTVEADGIKSQTKHLNFPSMITVPVIHSSDVNVKIIANYTMSNESVSPYALTKKAGNGEVTCLAVSPYFSAIENSAGDINKDFFGDIGSLLNVADLKLNKNIVERTDYFPQFDFVKDPVDFTGKVSIDTDYVQLPKLSANGMKVLPKDGEVKTVDLNNLTLESIEYVCPVEFRIDASEIHSSGIGLGRYLDIKISGDFSLTIEIPKDSNVEMSIWNGTTLLNEIFQDSTIQLSIKNDHETSVSVKNPTITTEGNAYFSRARVYRNYYEMPLFYNDGSEPFEVIGNVTFRIEYSDNGINFVDNFTFNGKWFYPTTEQKQPSLTEMDIPWLSVLTSPFHLILVTTISAVLVYATSRRKKMIERKKIIGIKLIWKA